MSMTITSSLRFLYIFGGSGLLLAVPIRCRRRLCRRCSSICGAQKKCSKCQRWYQVFEASLWLDFRVHNFTVPIFLSIFYSSVCSKKKCRQLNYFTHLTYTMISKIDYEQIGLRCQINECTRLAVAMCSSQFLLQLRVMNTYA